MQVSSLRFSVGLGSLLAVLILGSVYAAFIPLGDDTALNDELTPRDIASETQLHCVALAIYFEGGSTSESEEGQRHIARVVVERAKANLRKWGGSDLCDVVFYKKAGVCQFTFACLPLARRTPRPGKAWDQALAYATDELEGRSSILDDSIRYYMNPALTSDRNACRFRKEFVPVLVAGRHHFFREARRVRARGPAQQQSDRMPASRSGAGGPEACRQGEGRTREAAGAVEKEKEAACRHEASPESPRRRRQLSGITLRRYPPGRRVIERAAPRVTARS